MRHLTVALLVAVISLQVATVQFTSVKKHGVTVDLVGVVHVGSPQYYAMLDEKLKQYDCVLYELVAPRGTVPGVHNREPNMLHMFQQAMTMGLGLVHQLENINYDQRHFVHADLDAEGISFAMQEYGDTPITVGLTTIAAMMRQQNLQRLHGPVPEELTLQDILADPSALKRTMAKQMVAGVKQGGTPLGPALNRLLIDARNIECLRVLDRELAAGKKNIAIFYGAAHMPDFAKRLRLRDDRFFPQRIWWHDAWDLRPSPIAGLIPQGEVGEDMMQEALKESLHQMVDEFFN